MNVLLVCVCLIVADDGALIHEYALLTFQEDVHGTSAAATTTATTDWPLLWPPGG